MSSCEGRVGMCSQTHETTLPISGPWASRVCNLEYSNFYNKGFLHPAEPVTRVSLVDVPTIPWGLTHWAVLPSVLGRFGITGPRL